MSRPSRGVPTGKVLAAASAVVLGLASCPLAPQESAYSFSHDQTRVSHQSVALMAHSVIFLGGIGYEYGSTGMAGVLNGAYLGPEYTKYFVNTPEQYPNTGEDASVAKGTASTVALIQQIRQDDPDGTITLVTGSMGSIVGSRVNDHLIANSIPTDRINMVLLVNPSAGNGGYAARFGSSMTAPFTAISGGSPTQAGGAQILSIQNQYDLISDAPAYLFNGLAWANAILGFFTEHPKISPNLADPRNVVTTSADGTLTTTLVYAPQLPLTQPLRLVGIPGPVVDLLDRLLRPWIEAGYDRSNPAGSVPLSLAPTPDKWLGIIGSIVVGTVQGFLPPVAANPVPAQPDSIDSETNAPAASAKVERHTDSEESTHQPQESASGERPAATRKRQPAVPQDVVDPLESQNDRTPQSNVRPSRPSERGRDAPEPPDPDAAVPEIAVANPSVDLNATDRRRQHFEPGGGIKHTLDAVHRATHAVAPERPVTSGAAGGEESDRSSTSGADSELSRSDW